MSRVGIKGRVGGLRRSVANATPGSTPALAPIDRDAALPARVCLTWKLSRTALARVRPAFAAPARSDKPATLRLRLTREMDGWHADALLRDPVTGITQVLPIEHGSVKATREGHWIHLEAEGLLRASLRAADGTVAYAATPILGELGLGGGRYELDRAAGTG